MDDFMSSLLCQENETCYEDNSFIPSLQEHGVSEAEYISILIQRETELGFKNGESSSSSSSSSSMLVHWIKSTRMDVINWILQTSSTLGFRFQTAYLSVTYLDRFLSKCSIDSDKYWLMRLLSVACLTLSAKMEECNSPALPEFQLEGYCFESKVIRRMELLVLSTLEWNMAIITPLSFLPYFITKLCSNESSTNQLLSKTMQHIFTLMKEVNIMDHRPSVVAAAAILAASNQKLTIEAIELKMSSIHQCRFLETKDIFACYCQIQRLCIEKTRRDRLVHSPSPSRVASAADRRRLEFNDNKEIYDENGFQ